jgi:hypothetical protein
LGKTEPISTLENLSCRNFSFAKLAQFSKGNNVLDARACNTECFPWKDTHVSTIQLNRPILNRVYLHLEKMKVQ